MDEIEEFIVGSDVACSDGRCGVLSRVIIDPIADAIAYLDVESRRRRHNGRLVPISLVATAAAEEIRLKCSKAEFEALAPAQEQEFLPAVEEQGYSPGQALRLPYFRLTGHVPAMPDSPRPGHDRARVSSEVTFATLPLGDVDVCRGEHVEATDGPIGKVKGLVIDPSDEQVTHILLDEGHLWGEKTVAIPISATKRLGEVIRLSLSKDEIGQLPAVDVEHPV
jgi:hypothetical protein